MADEKEQATPEQATPQQRGMLLGNIANIADTVVNGAVGLTGLFHKDARDANVRIAEANARAAEANAPDKTDDDKIFGIDKKIVYIAGGVIGLIILITLLKPKQND